MIRALLRGACSTLLLVGGFASYLAFAYAIERPSDPAAARELRQALGIYGRLVTLLGLLPHLWIALPLGALLERRFPERVRSRSGLAILLAVAVGLAGLFVVATVMRLGLPGAPRLVFSGPADFVTTWLEMSLGVFAAALLPRLIWPPRRQA